MTTEPTRDSLDEATSSVTIYGYSDDLIEVEGAVRGEFTLPSGDVAFVALSNGVVVRILYSRSGVWRINLVSKPGDVAVLVTSAPEDDDDNYTDRCVVTGGDIAWAVLGTDVTRARA